MLSEFIYPIKMAILILPFLIMVLAIPLIIYQYNKYGSTHWWRIFTLYSFFFYLLVAYYLVILPLPSYEYVENMSPVNIQLEPFYFINYFRYQGLREGLGAWLNFFKTRAFQQLFFNVLLTVPFGVYLRYYFKKGFFTTLLLSFLLSLFFELTQLSALYGLYPQPYRIFDVDDLFLNTLGGVVGYIFTPLIVYFFPTKEDMDKDSYKRSEDVSLLRRLMAVIIDLIPFIGFVIVIQFQYEWELLLQRMDLIAIGILCMVIYMTLLTYLFKGNTIGKSLVRIKLQTQDRDYPSFKGVFIRYLILGVITFALYFSIYHLFLNNSPEIDDDLLGMLGLILVMGLIVTDVLIGWLNKSPLIHERISGTTNISTSDYSTTV